MIMFIDREEELKKLLEIAKSKRAELVLVYGRRRVGKSRLLIEFAKKTNALYFLADLSKNILDILSSQIKDEFVKFSNWEDFFNFIYRSKYKIIIIDEFQYLYQTNKAWLSILQRWWEKLKETDKKIILCGSIISTIYKIASGYGSALYGRKTYEIEIAPLKFKFIKNFLPKYKINELIEAYSILGGIPRYLEEFDSNLSIEENLRKKVLDKTCFLYNEPLNLFFEEFRDPSPYFSILLAISQGYNRFIEISQFSNIEANKLPKYLLILERVKIIEKEIPVTESKIKIKNTRYKIKDNFYKFWFTFVFKNRAMLEQNAIEEVLSYIMNNFNSYVANCFEDICKELLFDIKIFKFNKVGKWWYKDNEIDIVAINDQTKEILFAECKWKEKVNAEKELKELKKKAEMVKWNEENRKEYFAIFAKSFKEKFKEENVFLFDLKDIEKALNK